MTSHEREHPERSDQTEGLGRIAHEQPLNGRTEVFALGCETVESSRLAGPAQLAIPRLGLCEVVVGVTVAYPVGDWIGAEPLRCELADRLEHPHSFSGRSPYEALVEQRREHVH